MENKGHPRAKKPTASLKVSIDEELYAKTSKQLKRRYPLLEFVSPDIAEMSIKSQEDHHLFEFHQSHQDGLLKLRFCLSPHSTNLLSSVQLLTEINRFTKDSALRLHGNSSFNNNKKTYYKAQRKFEQLIKKSGTIKQKMKPLLDISADDQEIDQLFDESHSIETVLLQILKLSGLTSYQTCQLVVHEKGKTEAESLHLNESGSIVHSQLKAKKFNELYRLIKKSKNKHFNQTQILDKDLRIVGPFLAKEMETKEHDLLFIISRNGFLSPSEAEQNYFFSIIPALKQVFRFILTKSKLTEREQLLAQSFNHYPFPIIVTVGGNIIFKNKNVCDEHVDCLDNQTSTLEYDQFDLGADKMLLLFPPSRADLISDFNHYQRISLLGELLNTLKHELSNPLFGLKLTAEMLETESNNDEVQCSLKDIAQNAQRCQSIIDNFSNLYVGQEELKSVDLNFLIHEIMTLTKSETRGIALKYEEGADVHTNTIKTHTTWLTQIIFNLIVNASQAIKSTDRPLREFEICVFTQTSEKSVSIGVRDTGPGVPEELGETILKPYFTTKSNGTGLGLSICSNLSQRLGGCLEYQNNGPFPGATFWVHLPKK